MNLIDWEDGVSFHKGKYRKVIAILTAMSALNVVNYLHPIIGMHILPVVVCKFPKVLTRRICLKIKSFFSRRSLPLFLWPSLKEGGQRHPIFISSCILPKSLNTRCCHNVESLERDLSSLQVQETFIMLWTGRFPRIISWKGKKMFSIRKSQEEQSKCFSFCKNYHINQAML